MKGPRRVALALLLLGLVLALCGPVLLQKARPFLSTTEARLQLMLLQATPYVLCGALWLPWRQAYSDRIAVVFAALLAVAALALYLPMLSAPQSYDGDLLGLRFLVIMAWQVVGLLLLSGLFYLLRPRVS